MRANTAPKLVTPDNLNRTVPVKPRNVKFRKRECETVQKTIPGAIGHRVKKLSPINGQQLVTVPLPSIVWTVAGRRFKFFPRCNCRLNKIKGVSLAEFWTQARPRAKDLHSRGGDGTGRVP